MSKFHSTVSRRDFMKALGLAGAGLGAGAAAAPVFHDLSELANSSKATFKRPWYVKEREFKNPTTEVDWSIFEAWQVGPFNQYAPVEYGGAYSKQCGFKHRESDYEYHNAANIRQDGIRESGLKSGTPGYALRDVALYEGIQFNYVFGNQFHFGDIPWTGEEVKSPEERGVSRWTGTPEEATKMVRAAAHHFGSYNIGILELDSDTRKLAQPSSVRFEDVDTADQDGYVKVIPNKSKWAITIAVQQSTEMEKRGLTMQALGADSAYALAGHYCQLRLQRFVKTLGYQALLPGTTAIMNVPAGILSGTGELSRMTHQITPEHGPFIRYTPALVTDLPLTPTKPIDAGIFKFCETCLICAETCDEVNGQTPLSLKAEPTWEVDGPYSRIGVKAHQIAWGRCLWCPYCQGSCPFGRHNISPLHNIITATVANTSIFNGFFADMEHTFGYGLHDSEQYCRDWWERDLNNWEYDPNLGGSG